MNRQQTDQEIKTVILSAISSEGERNRLVRLCARLTGDPSVAEDLTQETLITAWRHCEQVTNPAGISAWLATIAHNHCRNWIRSRSRQQKYIVAGADLDSSAAINTIEACEDFDLDVELEREEIVALLDRAIVHLPKETQTLLVDHYIEEIPQLELAAQLGIQSSAIASRLNRGKTALRRLLVTEFSDDALALGLISSDNVGWQSTRIWCTNCGQKKMRGKFASEGDGQLILQCDCGANFGVSGPSGLLEGVRGFRPALNRSRQWRHTFFQAGLRTGEVDCPCCTKTVKLHLNVHTPVPAFFGPRPADEQCVWAHCTACGWHHHSDLGGLSGAYPEWLHFWRQHPRMNSLPIQQIEYQGAPASLVSVRSHNDDAQLDLIFHAKTFVRLNSS
ncbi:RNA polymerase sigma factor [Chloroflexi bacterium TSY]|nr:RNA polymerase sigma factor [Chloroflexi bacterium TSY]